MCVCVRVSDRQNGVSTMLRSKAADQSPADDVDDPSKTSPAHEVSLDT